MVAMSARIGSNLQHQRDKLQISMSQRNAGRSYPENQSSTQVSCANAHFHVKVEFRLRGECFCRPGLFALVIAKPLSGTVTRPTLLRNAPTSSSSRFIDGWQPAPTEF